MKANTKQMKTIALSALVICAVGMIVCRHFEAQYPWLGWVRAFCEAGTVGALADWFAVVALFRHPLGIPIPHTAILPNNKERVADSLATFIETSFLTREAMEPHLRNIDYASETAKFLERHTATIAEKAMQFTPQLLATIDDREITDLLAARARAMIEGTPFGSLAATSLQALTENGRDTEIFVALLKSVHKLVEENRFVIQQKIHEEIPLPTLSDIPIVASVVAPMLGTIKEALAASVAEKTVRKVQDALHEASQNPNHPLRVSFDVRLQQLLADLKNSPAMHEKIHSLQSKLAASVTIDTFAVYAWTEIREFILHNTASADSVLRHKLEGIIANAAKSLGENARTRTAINEFFSEQIIEVALNSKTYIRDLVVNTIGKWDARMMSERLEHVVGADLQFIRLNGTLVGGLAGLAIHALYRIFAQ